MCVPGKFVIKFLPDEGDMDDMQLTWEELLGEKPCLKSWCAFVLLGGISRRDCTPVRVPVTGGSVT